MTARDIIARLEETRNNMTTQDSKDETRRQRIRVNTEKAIQFCRQLAPTRKTTKQDMAAMKRNALCSADIANAPHVVPDLDAELAVQSVARALYNIANMQRR